jgi:hypothetical protein
MRAGQDDAELGGYAVFVAPLWLSISLTVIAWKPLNRTDRYDRGPSATISLDLYFLYSLKPLDCSHSTVVLLNSGMRLLNPGTQPSAIWHHILAE